MFRRFIERTPKGLFSVGLPLIGAMLGGTYLLAESLDPRIQSKRRTVDKKDLEAIEQGERIVMDINSATTRTRSAPVGSRKLRPIKEAFPEHLQTLASEDIQGWTQDYEMVRVPRPQGEDLWDAKR
eukprot:TRINITY_DN36593_c0_g1_i1.p1 TRINITY_DN36593_c0_g1~~TRINITY_DN36593_c0_g1_i1.p1  ORF type:complete len:126 (+),score=3.37 TRINITY_DN36593_c0_g1_i1:234-611(+)